MRACTAGCCDGEIRTLKVEHDGECTRDHVDDRARYKEGGYFTRTGRLNSTKRVFNRGDTANARPCGNADSQRVISGVLQSGITHRLYAGHNTVMKKLVYATRFFQRDVFGDIEVADRTTEAGGKDRKSVV